MSVPVRLATMVAGLVTVFVLAFGVGRVTGGADVGGGAGSQPEGEAEVHDTDGDADHGAEPGQHGAGEGG